MLTLEEARAAILQRIIPATDVENLPLSAVRGRYAAAEIRARVDNPAFDNSAMDGYALSAADLARANFRLPLAGESAAGSMPGALTPGTCMRVFTGAPIPPGADTVVIQEDIKREGDAVVFPRNAQPGANIRRQGEDFKSGDLLFAPGRRLGAVKLALLATAGVAQVDVFRHARVLVVATGDELVAPGAALRPGQIYESNRLATLAQLEDFGVAAVDGGTVRDDPVQLRALLQRSVDYDFVITSGGASVGDHDLVKQVFAEIGEIEFWKVRIKPGKPLAFGRIGTRTHFFALPGNPVSSLVTYKLFVEPALATWHHATPTDWRLPATAANGFRRHPGRTEFLRARLFTEDGKLMAEALKGQGSHMLAPIRDTNGFIRVEADSAGFGAGEPVTVVPLFIR
jgi:molybdopterin molybdotransferase